MPRPASRLLAAILLAAPLAACGGAAASSPTEEPSPSAAMDADGYVAVLTQLADGLDEVVASQGSDASVDRVLSLIDEANAYAPYFASLPPAEASQIADQYGDQVQEIALRIASAAQQAIDASGDGRILQALQNVPSFAIATKTQSP